MRATRHRLPKGTLLRRGATWWAQWKHGGRPFGVSLGTKDQREAKARFAAHMSAVRGAILDGSHASRFGGPYRAPLAAGEDCPLAVAWEAFAASPRRPDSSAETLKQYGYQFARFADWVRERRPEAKLLSGIDEAVAEAYAADLEKAVSPSTFNRHRDLLQMAFKVLLARNGRVPANPWTAIRRKRSGNGHARREFSADELRRIFLTLRRRVEGFQVVWGEDGVAGERKLAFDHSHARTLRRPATRRLLPVALGGSGPRIRLDRPAPVEDLAPRGQAGGDPHPPGPAPTAG
jgi:hypothetical protein